VDGAGWKGHRQPGAEPDNLFGWLGRSADRLTARKQTRQQAHGLEEFEFVTAFEQRRF
jgi:hypothetical protein